jgi:hypothetical protein
VATPRVRARRVVDAGPYAEVPVRRLTWLCGLAAWLSGLCETKRDVKVVGLVQAAVDADGRAAPQTFVENPRPAASVRGVGFGQLEQREDGAVPGGKRVLRRPVRVGSHAR